MISCPTCGSKHTKKSGMIGKMVMTKTGKRTRHVQSYRCEAGHFFKGPGHAAWDDSFIELVVYFISAVYL